MKKYLSTIFMLLPLYGFSSYVFVYNADPQKDKILLAGYYGDHPNWRDVSSQNVPEVKNKNAGIINSNTGAYFKFTQNTRYVNQRYLVSKYRPGTSADDQIWSNFKDKAYFYIADLNGRNDVPKNASYSSYYPSRDIKSAEKGYGDNFFTFISSKDVDGITTSAKSGGDARNKKTIEKLARESNYLATVGGLDTHILGNKHHAVVGIFVWTGAWSALNYWVSKNLTQEFQSEFIANVTDPRNIDSEFENWISSKYNSGSQIDNAKKDIMKWYKKIIIGDKSACAKEDELNCIGAVNSVVLDDIAAAKKSDTLMDLLNEATGMFAHMGNDLGPSWNQTVNDTFAISKPFFALIKRDYYRFIPTGDYKSSSLYYPKCFGKEYGYGVENKNGVLSCVKSPI